MVVKNWFNLSLIFSIALLAVATFTTLKVLPVQAADIDFSDGITVDSTLDSIDANIGNGICDDGAGNCTLRAAIQEANSNIDASVIKFNIAEAADFTNGGQSGYTIAPASWLPDLSTPITVDGYTQPGSLANSAVAPNPLNGRLLVELDGTDMGVNTCLSITGAGSRVSGLVVNDCGYDGIAADGDNLTISGNYIGTNYLGTAAKPVSKRGISGWGADGDNVAIGGTNPADRNLISGNGIGLDGGGIGIGTGHDNWIIRGNYIGTNAAGVAAIPNSQPIGSGSPSVDYVSGTIIGGSMAGAANLISGNYGHGIAPYEAPNTHIEGNYIGTTYTGTVALGNSGAGVTFGLNSDGSSVINNIISANGREGVLIGDSDNVVVQGNKIGTGASGVESIPNNQAGISITNSNNALVGGTLSQDVNTIVNSTTYAGVVISGTSTSNSVLRNSIHSNFLVGIDLSGDIVTLNDALDPDTGPNNLLNFPDNLQYIVNSGNTDMSYTLDVPAGQYRVEFFSNTGADASGYGEGETYLGSHDIVKSGSGSQAFAHTLTGVSLPNISATATLKDGSADGFGPTSEFSATATQRPPVTDISLEKTILNPGGVSAGGAIDYQLTITNNGSDDLDLTQFDNPLGTAIISDFLDPDLTPINLGSPEPSLPGSFYLSDVGNPDLTCLWGGPGSGALVGLTTYGDYSFVSCIFTGAGDTTLEAGQSLSMVLNVNIAGDSDMVFTNYAFATPSTLGDPDNAAIGSIFGVGEDYLALFIANQSSNSPINNFASVAYPLPVEPGVSVTTSPPSPLAAAGTNEYTWLILSLALISGSAWFASQALRGHSRSRS